MLLHTNALFLKSGRQFGGFLLAHPEILVPLLLVSGPQDDSFSPVSALGYMHWSARTWSVNGP